MQIYIMGCGRSGTTLMLALMSCFEDTFTLVDDAKVPGEDDYQAFERIAGQSERHHVIKRSSGAYKVATEIPREIGLVYMVRHPLDVMTSTLNYRQQQYENYIPPDRWLAEAEALRAVIESGRSNCLVVSYEQLVTSPDATQEIMATSFGLEPGRPFSKFQDAFVASKDIDETLNGFRPVDAKSVGRWRDPVHREHLRQVWEAVQPTGKWFCDRFGYALEEIDSHLYA